MLGKAASIIRPKNGDKCTTVSPTPSKPPMIMIVWGSVFAGVVAWLAVTVMKLQRQMMILEGLIATKKGSDARRPIGGMPPAQQPSNQANPLDGALGQLFGRRAPSRKPHPSRPWPPKQPVRRSQPPTQPAPKPPPQKSLE